MSISPQSPLGIAKLVSGHKFKVPRFQRAFGWRKSEIQEFFADIGAALKKSGGNDYFLGIVVLMKIDDQHLLIIDGQQRIALTCMIYAAIRERLKHYSPEDSEQAAQLLFDNGGVGKKRGPRLLLSNDQQEFFISHVLDGKATAPRPGHRSAGVKSPNEKRIESAFKQVKEKVGELATSDDKTALSVLSQWDDFLRNRAVVLPLHVTDERTAFQLFETMNDRGKDLTTEDLLKNYIYGLVEKSRLENVQKLWEDAMDSVRTSSRESAGTKFIHHYWTSKHGLTRERQLYDAIRDQIRTSEAAIDLVTDLERTSRFYFAILNGSGVFEDFRDLKLDQCKPLLLACLDVLNDKKDRDVTSVLRMILNWSVRFRTAGKFGSSELEEFYADAGPAVRNAKISNARALHALFESKVPDDATFEKDFFKFDEDAPQFARYVLREIAQHMEGDRVERVPNRDTSDLNLEHIFPKRAKLNEWPGFDKNSAKTYLNRFGNLTLLGTIPNCEVGDAPYIEKRSVYRDCPLRLTSEIAKAFPKEWTPASVDKRQREMARIAKSLWQATP